jgi:cytoskeletal protein CcmA (bactofilin family)
LGFFNRKPPEPPPPKTYFAKGTKLKGDLECRDEMTLAGALEGSIRSQGRVILDPSAHFSGTLNSESLQCQGAGEGFLEVEGTASFGAGSSWSGEFKAGALHIEKGAQLGGTFRPRGAPSQDVPSKKTKKQ